MNIYKGFFLFALWFPFFQYQAIAEESVALLNQASANTSKMLIPNGTNLRGWDSLVNKLLSKGVSPDKLISIYAKKNFPYFTNVSFSVEPKESSYMYRGFTSKRNLQAARSFLNKHSSTFKKTAEVYDTEPKVVAAILLIETHFGRNTGNNQVIYRLSRLANISDPNNIRFNYKDKKSKDKRVTFNQVLKRAQYLENTFLPEVKATIDVAEENNISVFHIKGSSAGAFGWPQFLPTSYIKYAVDYNQDGKRSLYDTEDAIASIANYLRAHGWKSNISMKEKRQIIWQYNKSEAYIDTVLKVAELI